MCPRHEDAEDAVQEIFVEIWRNAEKFNPDVASEATYITMIARRRLIDKYRRRSRELDTTSLAEELVTGTTDHEKQIDISDEAEHARQYMQQLRPEERKVLELSINDGMSQSQIAEKIDLPLGTVKTHARRGLIRLRELLGESAVGEVKGAGA
jgi:RNA polymerase sigma-70 factor (ECF subfamily)